jgi:hypothetical protein
MKNRHRLRWALLLLASSTTYAAANAACDEQFMTTLHQCERIVGSLRYDKLSQARVFASDGSVYTAGQAQWMKGQLRLVEQECTGGNTADAARRLADVEELLREHHSTLS